MKHSTQARWNLARFTGMLTALAVAVAMTALVGCVAQDGKDGADGATGPTGLAGTAQCAACHNDSTTMLAKILQYQNSTHYTGLTFARSDATCARCHTNEGFIQHITTGIDTFKVAGVASGVPNPTPQNCRTCHNVHTNFDSTDFDLRLEGQVQIRVSGESFNFGKSAACATCHQPRPSTPLPTVSVTDSVNFANNRWGPHYGAQAGILKGAGGYELSGALPYTNSEHAIAAENGCVDCHMSRPFGASAGGHSMQLSHGTNNTPLLTGCYTCHDVTEPAATRLTNFNFRGVKDSTNALMDTLKTLLIARNVMDTLALSKFPTKQPAHYAGAFWNYKLVYADGSKGNHNWPYTKALLLNSIQALRQ
jgi:hypothetical protein